MIRKFDFLVIGSGVAGMSYALKVAESGKGKVAIICKTTLEEANTSKAQGGIASVTNFKVDNFEKHIKDTMIAGDYISDPAAVEQVVKNGPKGIEDLVRWGVNFDKNKEGEFDLHREGGHSEFRILHHADDTGFEIQRGLMEAVRRNKNITILLQLACTCSIIKICYCMNKVFVHTMENKAIINSIDNISTTTDIGFTKKCHRLARVCNKNDMYLFFHCKIL